MCEVVSKLPTVESEARSLEALLVVALLSLTDVAGREGVVEIAYTRPLSKTVRWRLQRVLVASAGYEAPTAAENPEALNTAATEGESS